MDNIKDIERKDSIGQFLGDKVIRTNPFGDNLFAVRVYLRAEKIVAAIYLVTKHLSESEPARMRIRQSALGLLSSILAVRDEMRVLGSDTLVQAKVLIRELISLVRVLSIGGNLSTSNAEVLIDALDDLGSLLHSAQKTPLSESVLLIREDLIDIQNIRMGHGRSPVISKGQSQRLLKDVRNHAERMSDKRSKGHRTDNILDILGSKEKLGIKDIVSRFPEYSEKMVQRELKSLVAGGRVKKIGSKRWSMYTLA